MQQIARSSDFSNVEKNEGEIFNNVRYVCQSCTLITESLKKGCDVLQMSNGDVVITEVKVFTYHYAWDEVKGKFIRSKSDRRAKRLKGGKFEEDENLDDELQNYNELETV